MATEIVDIHRLEAKSFSPLLDLESRSWREALHWDFAASAGLISACLREKRISGHALTAGCSVKGYCFFFLEGDKGLIGDLFTEHAKTDPKQGLPLLERTIESLLTNDTVRRVEAQLPYFSFEQLDPCFHAHCFKGYRRRFMAACFEKGPQEPSGSLPRQAETLPKGRRIFQDFAIERWDRRYDREASELLYKVYTGHVDAAINDKYSSMKGTSQLIESIVLRKGCGEYLPGASLVAVHRSTGKLAAILAFTAVQPRTAHIPQIAVAQEFQGARLGQTMIMMSLAERAREGYEEVSLTVTDLNSGALRLYERLGFKTFRTFGAFVWDRS